MIERKDAPAIKDNFYAEFRRIEHEEQAKPAAAKISLGPGADPGRCDSG